MKSFVRNYHQKLEEQLLVKEEEVKYIHYIQNTSVQSVMKILQILDVMKNFANQKLKKNVQYFVELKFLFKTYSII